MRFLKIEKKRFFKKKDLMKLIKFFNILFIFYKDLIYYQNTQNDQKRLCVSKNLK